jgi:hypothetical protein
MARTPKTLIRDMERLKMKLAKLRDDFRDIEAEASELSDISGDAVDSLEYAIDRLSEQV